MTKKEQIWKYWVGTEMSTEQIVAVDEYTEYVAREAFESGALVYRSPRLQEDFEDWLADFKTKERLEYERDRGMG